MLAADIKPILATHLHPRYKKLIYELGIARGQVIADVVGMGPGLLHGYEIKSDGDSLKRLPNQLNTYDRVFGEVWVVVTRKHLPKIKALLSPHHGVIMVGAHGCEVLKLAQENPNVYKRTLVNLLWKQHSLDYLQELGHAHGFRSKRCGEIQQKLCSVTTIEQIRDRVILEIDRRYPDLTTISELDPSAGSTQGTADPD